MKTILRTSLLFSRRDGTAVYIPDGCLIADARDRIAEVGAWDAIAPKLGSDAAVRQIADAIVMPPMLDLHTHVSQHPIRGRFVEGVEELPEEGRLVVGLRRNVFPAEIRCADPTHAVEVARAFEEDARANGVIGGAAYMTVHPAATEAALEVLGEAWHVGLVMMDQNCPPELRTNAATLERDVARLVERFGRRFIMTDRFALGCSSPLRRKGVELAKRYGLRMQTHLNEQVAEKQMVEQVLYPEVGSYCGVYERDGLLDCQPILAHCIHNRSEELEMLQSRAVTIAHCPVSNALLGSGILPLDAIVDAGIDWCLCTDVGASPSTSLLVEMAQFLIVHRDRSRRATASEALYRTTLAPARALGLEDRMGTFEVGMPLAYVVVQCDQAAEGEDVDSFIEQRLLGLSEADFTAERDVLDRLASEATALTPADLERLGGAVAGRARRLEGRIREVVQPLAGF